MQHLFHSTPIRSLSIAGILAIFAQIPAQAAVTLTVDTLAKTFTWSGTATSDFFSIPELGSKSIRLGTGSWIGGIADDVGEGSLGVGLNPGSGASASLSVGSWAGIPVLAGSQNSIYTDLAIVSNFSGIPEGPSTASLTITGNSQTYSYAGLDSGSMSYLESLDGTQLYFQDDQGGMGVFNIGSAAGQVVVVPEPSGALFLLAAPFFLSLRRRRA